MRTLSGAAILLCLLAVQSRAADTADKDKVQGAWVVTAIEFGGQKIDVPKGEETTFEFKGEKFTIKGKNKEVQGTVKIDEKKKEIALTAPKDGSNPAVLETQVGLYKLEGDMMKLAFSTKEKGKPPSGFDDKESAVLHLKKK
jgi:uncharacterized protein (TIGR03067 family)